MLRVCKFWTYQLKKQRRFLSVFQSPLITLTLYFKRNINSCLIYISFQAQCLQNTWLYEFKKHLCSPIVTPLITSIKEACYVDELQYKKEGSLNYWDTVLWGSGINHHYHMWILKNYFWKIYKSRSFHEINFSITFDFWTHTTWTNWQLPYRNSPQCFSSLDMFNRL